MIAVFMGKFIIILKLHGWPHTGNQIRHGYDSLWGEKNEGVKVVKLQVFIYKETSTGSGGA
jgi:hypothetical protein